MPPASSTTDAGPDCFAPLERGSVLAGYRIRRVLSRANGGALHQARTGHGGRALLRVLATRLRAPEARARVEAELERLGRVNHRCVARLVGKGEEDGAPWFALEDPGGRSLLDLVRRAGPLDAREVAWIGHGLAAGLGALHAAGLVHGNVTPQAIHITEVGPVLVDLGWAGRVGPAGAPTDARVDVRALAAALCFASTGAASRLPVPGGPADDPPGLPREVQDVLGQALDPGLPCPAVDKVKRVFQRAAEALGLLDTGAPASLGSRLRQAGRKGDDDTPPGGVPRGGAPDDPTVVLPEDSKAGSQEASRGDSKSGTKRARRPTKDGAEATATSVEVDRLRSAGVGARPSLPSAAGLASGRPDTRSAPRLSTSTRVERKPSVLSLPPSLALGEGSDEVAALASTPGLPSGRAAEPTAGQAEVLRVDSLIGGESVDAPMHHPAPVDSAPAGARPSLPPAGLGEAAPPPAPAVEPKRETHPFASASGSPAKFEAALAAPSGTGSQDEGAPPDLDLRPGLELIHRRLLGQGGMGVVHLVLDPRLGRRAALKLLRAPVTPTRVRRFRREIVVTSRLDHPGIPPVYEAGQTAIGTHYLLMRFVDGESLAEVFARRSTRGPVTGRETDREARDLLHALVKVGEAVAYAHSRGIVHRDLKPANLMLGAFGEVLVMDWGLARDLHESEDEDAWVRTELVGAAAEGAAAAPVSVGQTVDSDSDVGRAGAEAAAEEKAAGAKEGQAKAGEAGEAKGGEEGEKQRGITQDGAVLGTPGYLAPEQARGEDVDGRADVFALGAILAELLTGKPPVVGPTLLAVLGLTRGGEVEFPRMRYVTVDPELDAIASRALAPDCEERYPSAEAFVVDLRAYLEGRNVSAYRYRPLERLRRFVRRNPWLMAALGVALLLWGVTHVLLRRVEAEAERTRQEQRDKTLSSVTALVAEGEVSLEAHRALEARERFVTALALLPEHPGATAGKRLAERLIVDEARAAKERATASEAEARRARDVEQASALIAEGQAALEKGELEAARRAYEQALAFEAAPPAAREGLVRVEERLAAAAAEEQAARERRRDEGNARRFEDEGRAALARGDHRAAQAAFVSALAFGSEEAQRLLLEVETALVEGRSREVQAELARRQAAEASRLVRRGADSLAQERLEEARTAFIQALGFDGASQPAQKGLIDTDRALQARAEAERTAATRRDRGRRVREQLDLARAALARGREQQKGGQKPAMRESMFASLAALDQALFLAPDHQTIRDEKAQVARELATYLFEDGHRELGEFVLRLAGGGPADAPAATDPQSDPHLTVVEADQVRIAQVFDGQARFQPSHAFDRLRDAVRAQGDRWRVTIQVRSEATTGSPPQILVKGFWIRIEDRQSGTVLPTLKFDVQGGPYPRQVTVDASGRFIVAWERAHGLDEERYIREIDAAVRRLIEPPAPPEAPDGS